MGKDTVVITYPFSTSEILVDTAIARGYEPLILLPRIDSPTIDMVCGFVREMFKGRAEIVECKDDVEDALSKLSGRNIVAVMPGNDVGIGLVDQLCKRLNLPGNDPDSSWRRTTKYGMNKSLAEKGLPHIVTEIIKDTDQLRSVWEDQKLDVAVLKFTESAASVGMKVCHSLDEAIAHFNNMREVGNNVGSKDVDILLQEFAIGKEYAVNTASCNGKHTITDVWADNVKVIDGNVVYDSLSVDDTDEAPEGLIDYALKVLDAVGFRNGLCHSEFMMTSKGPVLIEVNPRPMGANQNEKFQKAVFGVTYADWMFAALLDPEEFRKMSGKEYRTLASAAMESTYCFDDIEADPSPLIELTKGMRTFFELPLATGIRKLRKTIDLASCLAQMKLVGPKDLMTKEFFMLKDIEENYPWLLFSTGPLDTENDNAEITAQKSEGGLKISVSDGAFLQDLYKVIIDGIRSLPKDGRMVFDEHTVSILPYGQDGLDRAMGILGMVPSADDSHIYVKSY